MIDLYYYPSPNCRKALIALEELDLAYRLRWVDITAGEQFAEQYLAVNPNGKVPAIVDHDGPAGTPLRVFESGAVLLYLATKTGRLLPADPTDRWEATCWVFWQVANHGPMAGQAAHFRHHATAQGIEDEYATGRYVAECRRLYGVLDDRLRHREFLAGEFSVADVACYPWVRVAQGHGVELADFPAVADWSRRLGERPAMGVRPADPREAAARASGYTAEQFRTLFRPGAPGATTSEGQP